MDGRNVAVGEDGTVTYRASALGDGCTRALVLSRLGYDERPPPQQMQERYNEGHLHEGAVLGRMREEGWTIWDEQATVTLMVSGKIRVVGHIDAKGALVTKTGNVGGEARIVEVKTQSKDEFAKFEKDGWEGGLWPRYKWQLSCYMLATGLPAVVVRKDRNSGTIRPEWVDEPFYTLAQIRARVLSVEMLAADGIGPEECGPERIWPCPFYYMPGHDGAIDRTISKSGTVPVPRRMLVGEEAKVVDRLARRHTIAAANEKSAREAKDSAKRDLLAVGEGSAGLDLDTGTRVTFYEQRVGRRGLSAEMEERLRAVCLWYFGVDIDNYRDQARAQMMRVTLADTTTETENKDGDV